MTTLAEYNNNPGNIRPAKGVKYEGLIGVDEKGFGVFEKPEFGEKALINDLTYKLKKRGIKSPSEFVDIYSPAGDENSEDARDNYKIYIAQKLGLKSTGDPFPDDAVSKLAQAVTAFEGGTWQGKEQDKKEDKGEESKEVVPGSTDVIPDPEAGPPSDANDQMALAYGAKGALLATGIEGTKQLYSAGRSILGRGGSDMVSQPTSRDNLQRYLNSQLADDLKIPLKDFEKMAGAGKPMRTMAEIQAGLTNIRGAPAQRTQRVDPVTGQGKGVYTTTPAKAPIDLSAYKSTPTIMSRAGDVASATGSVAKTVAPPVARVGLGALGGAMAGSQLYDAFNDYKEEGGGLPSMRTASKFASGAGGALGMLPFGVTQGVGAILQIPEAAYQLKEYRDRRRAGPQQDTDRIYQDNPMP